MSRSLLYAVFGDDVCFVSPFKAGCLFMYTFFDRYTCLHHSERTSYALLRLAYRHLGSTLSAPTYVCTL